MNSPRPVSSTSNLGIDVVTNMGDFAAHLEALFTQLPTVSEASFPQWIAKLSAIALGSEHNFLTVLIFANRVFSATNSHLVRRAVQEIESLGKSQFEEQQILLQETVKYSHSSLTPEIIAAFINIANTKVYLPSIRT